MELKDTPIKDNIAVSEYKGEFIKANIGVYDGVNETQSRNEVVFFSLNKCVR